MIASPARDFPPPRHSDDWRIVVTGIGLTSPNGNTLKEYRENLLAGVSGVSKYEIRYIGETLAGGGNGGPVVRRDVPYLLK